MTWLADRLLLVEDFVPSDTAAWLASFVAHGHEPLTTLYDQYTDGDVAYQIRQIGQRIAGEASCFYGQPLRVETLLLAAKKDGAWDEPHADAQRRTNQQPAVQVSYAGGVPQNGTTAVPLTAGGQWIANHSPNRRAVGIVYLNSAEDYGRGGELAFPQLGVTMLPRTGRLVVWPSHALWEHTVHPIPGPRARCTLACWMTLEV